MAILAFIISVAAYRLDFADKQMPWGDFVGKLATKTVWQGVLAAITFMLIIFWVFTSVQAGEVATRQTETETQGGESTPFISSTASTLPSTIPTFPTVSVSNQSSQMPIVCADLQLLPDVPPSAPPSVLPLRWEVLVILFFLPALCVLFLQMTKDYNLNLKQGHMMLLILALILSWPMCAVYLYLGVTPGRNITTVVSDALLKEPPESVRVLYFGRVFGEMRKALETEFRQSYNSSEPRLLIRYGYWRGRASFSLGENLYKDFTLSPIPQVDQRWEVVTNDLGCAIMDFEWALKQVQETDSDRETNYGRIYFFLGRTYHLIASINSISGYTKEADSYYGLALGNYQRAIELQCEYECRAVAPLYKGEVALQLGLIEDATNNFCTCRSRRSGLQEGPRMVCEEYLREIGFEPNSCPGGG